MLQIDDRPPRADTGRAAPARYDFGRPAALSREHARALEGAFDAFARLWAMQLASKTRSRCTIAVDGVTLETYDEYVSTVPTTTTLVVCAAESGEDSAIVEFPLPTALTWIARLVGGEISEVLDGRALTVVEQALLRALLTETLTHLRGSLGGLVPTELSVGGVQYNAAFAPIVAAQDLVVVARFSMAFSGHTAAASLALPAAALLERLSRSAAAPHASPDPAEVRRHVEQTPVEVALRLAPRRVRPDEVLDLAVGDLLTLPHGQHRPLDLAIGDDVIAAAAIGADGARLACIVTSTALSPSRAEELS